MFRRKTRITCVREERYYNWPVIINTKFNTLFRTSKKYYWIILFTAQIHESWLFYNLLEKQLNGFSTVFFQKINCFLKIFSCLLHNVCMNRAHVCITSARVCVTRAPVCITRAPVCITRAPVCITRAHVCITGTHVCMKMLHIFLPESPQCK